MSAPSSHKRGRHLRSADLRGIAQLATSGTAGVTRIVEGVHQSVWTTLGVPGGKAPGQTRGITGLVYKSVRGVTRLVGKGIDVTLGTLQPLLDALDAGAAPSPQREAVLAALNGVMGDRLAAQDSPFATPMSLRYHARALTPESLQALPENPGNKVLLLIHGLCMNDLQWSDAQPGEPGSHGDALACALGYTPLYLRYNSGQHVSRNGRELAQQLEQLCADWPAPLEELSVVAHSMGGLLIRSAVQLARQQGLRWPGMLRNIVFLGTPHHGAPLERAGNLVDVMLGSTPWSAPFARLGQLRSSGITDLRHGYVLDEDWQGRDRFGRHADNRRPLPLPAGVACFAVAATMATKRSALAERLLGDGLVPLRSALGQHRDAHRSLAFAADAQWVAYRTNHMRLLSDPAVRRQIIEWLGRTR